jgi:hypothetical protein
MPIPVQQFRPISFDEANPMLKGIRTGQQIFGTGLENLLKGIQAQYAPQMTEAELAQKLAQGRLTGEQAKWFGPTAQSEIGLRGAQTNRLNTMTPLEAEELKLKNQFYPQMTEAQIQNFKALADQRQMGGRPGAGVQEVNAFKKQIQMDNPNWDESMVNQAANAYMTGDNSINGQQLPQLSGMAKAFQSQIYKRNSTSQIQNTAAGMANTAHEINHIDIDPVKKFSGVAGRIKYASELAKMQVDPASVSEDFRQFQAFKNVTSTLAMDTMRKGFQTSVVPGYVYATLGKLSNPQSNIWNDPEQVEREWNKMKDWVNKSAESSVKQARYGATTELEDKKENRSESKAQRWVYDVASGKLIPK